MSQKTQLDFSALIAPMKWLLTGTVAVYLCAMLAVWVTGLPVQAAPAVVETVVPVSPSATPTGALGSRSPSATLKPADVPPTPTPNATPESPSTPLTVTVRAGDTLGSIARAYGVPVEDLIAANDLADPNLLYVGHELVIPGDGSPAPAPAAPAVAEVPAGPTPIPAPAQPDGIDETRWIDVDLSEQSLTAYEGDTPVHSTLVSTGLPGTPTPVGQFRIWIKLRYDDMAGADYYIEDVPFVMYFHQGYGLHGVTWHGNFGHPMSHGCVNLPTAEAEWLFNWADIGTLVNVHD
jgi:lipoprotein-anchoring transpeptidase ErfK/SrfK